MANPTKLNKLLIGARHVVTHRSLANFEHVDAEGDRNYKAAEERFLTFRTQLQDVITATELFRTRLGESSEAASLLANNFMKISHQPSETANEPWVAHAKKQSELLKSTSTGTSSLVQHILNADMDKFVLSDLKNQLASFSDVNRLVKERYELKVEVQHYSSKVQELDDNPKATQERKDRNNEKYALANNKLREQTDALIKRFDDAELRRKRMLVEDLPNLIDVQRQAFTVFYDNMTVASEGIEALPTTQPRKSADSSSNRPLTLSKGSHQRVFSGTSTTYDSNNNNIDHTASVYDSNNAINSSGGVGISDLPPAPGSKANKSSSHMADVSLSDDSIAHAANASLSDNITSTSQHSISSATSSSIYTGNTSTHKGTTTVKNSPIAAKSSSQTHNKSPSNEKAVSPKGVRRNPSDGVSVTTPAVTTPTVTTSPYDTSSSELRLKGLPLAASVGNSNISNKSITPKSNNNTNTEQNAIKENADISTVAVVADDDIDADDVNDTSIIHQDHGDDTQTDDAQFTSATAVLPTNSNDTSDNVEEHVYDEDAVTNNTNNNTNTGDVPPGFIRVRAVFDFDAAQPGDLSFKNKDIIITDGASYSGDGWVTGTCNGQTGLFPSNYTERFED